MTDRERDDISLELMRGMKEMFKLKTTGSNRLKTKGAQEGKDVQTQNHLVESTVQVKIEDTHESPNPIEQGRGIEKIGQDLHGFEIDVDEYDENLSLNDFVGWLIKMDKLFESLEMPEHHRFLFAKLKLQGGAKTWWSDVENSLRQQSLPSITSWEEMKLKLKGRFLAPDYKEYLFEELLSLRQENMSVEQYTRKFEELSFLNDMIEEPDWQTFVRYKIGLKPEIQSNMMTLEPLGFRDAVDLALKIEENLKPYSSGIGKKKKKKKKVQKEMEKNDESYYPFMMNVYCSGKLLTLAIATGTEGNYISDCIVNELQLQTKAHPCPYIASSVLGGPEFVVTKMCLVPISLRSFADDIWCDVVPMVTSNLLFGRLWLNDNDVTYGARDNIYIFNRNGRRTTWRPVKPTGDTTSPVCLSIVRKGLVNVETHESKGEQYI